MRLRHAHAKNPQVRKGFHRPDRINIPTLGPAIAHDCHDGVERRGGRTGTERGAMLGRDIDINHAYSVDGAQQRSPDAAAAALTGGAPANAASSAARQENSQSMMRGITLRC